MTYHPLSFRHSVRIVQYFVFTRASEVFALQASPVLGSFLGGFGLGWLDLTRLGVLLFGSLALTAHIFVFNDWAGYSSDILDPQRGAFVFTQKGISRRQVADVAIALLILANVAFAIVGGMSMLLSAAITAFSLLYSCSPNFGKSKPIVGSINHLLGGAAHFLLGYTFAHPLDANGLATSLFFGLVFAGGHLNQEVRDYEGDLINGIRTTAVVFGCQFAFLAGLGTFTAAYAIVTSLAVFGVLPSILLWSPLVWLLHLIWSFQGWHRGLGFETALWMQKRYRLLFALIGLAMLAR